MENFRLKVFRTVADNLNFRQAAEALYLTQPAVTLQIKALEEELGVPLFDRTENRVALTEAGRILLKHAKKVEALTAAARQELARLVGEEVGQLDRVGVAFLCTDHNRVRAGRRQGVQLRADIDDAAEEHLLALQSRAVSRHAHEHGARHLARRPLRAG